MTRINLVSPTELCDQQLLAEFRELTRIPNSISNGKQIQTDTVPNSYRLGEGHVRFFENKLTFLFNRYHELEQECVNRGFDVTNIWPNHLTATPELWQDYTPTQEAIKLNTDRINLRVHEMTRVPTFSGI